MNNNQTNNYNQVNEIAPEKVRQKDKSQADRKLTGKTFNYNEI